MYLINNNKLGIIVHAILVQAILVQTVISNKLNIISNRLIIPNNKLSILSNKPIMNSKKPGTRILEILLRESIRQHPGQFP